MDSSKNILLLTNAATDEEMNLVKDAFLNASQKGFIIRLSLVHVIPNLPTCYFNIPSMAKLAEEYYTDAKRCLNAAGVALGIAKKDQWLISGRIKTEVLRLANKLGSQFILASSASIKDLHKSFIPAKEFHSNQLKNMTSLAASKF